MLHAREMSSQQTRFHPRWRKRQLTFLRLGGWIPEEGTGWEESSADWGAGGWVGGMIERWSGYRTGKCMQATLAIKRWALGVTTKTFSLVTTAATKRDGGGTWERKEEEGAATNRKNSRQQCYTNISKELTRLCFIRTQLPVTSCMLHASRMVAWVSCCQIIFSKVFRS